MTKPFIIGVAGGSGSGKTTISSEIRRLIGDTHLTYIQHDSYYQEIGHLTSEERSARNYDHPNSLETDLLIEHLIRLKEGQSVEVPRYDFAIHNREAETDSVYPAPIILVEGILIFVDQQLRKQMDMRIFVDTDADLRFIRRLQRDMSERGRSFDSVIEQYMTTVRPMHLEFVEPSKRYADIIVPAHGYNPVAMDMIISRIEAIVEQYTSPGKLCPDS
ncbi:MAG: uridine kinase [Chloroflexota bacterium]